MGKLGQRLGLIRARRGLSFREFGEAIGEDFTLLFKIENGSRVPPAKKRAKYAHLLELSETQLNAIIALEAAELAVDKFCPEIQPPLREADEIETIAASLLDAFEQRAGRSKRSTIDPAEIAREMYGYETRLVDFRRANLRGPRNEELNACLFPKNEMFNRQDRLILVNNGLIKNRRLSTPQRRVAQAHELGHIALHCEDRLKTSQLTLNFEAAPLYCSSVTSPAAGDIREEQATTFAACLLLPKKDEQIFRSVKRRDFSALANEYGVTPELVNIRLKTLGCAT